MIRNPTDFIAGIFLLICATLGWWFGQPLKVGTAFRMGPGYVPMLLASVLAVFGLLLCLFGVFRQGSRLEPWNIRPIVLVLGALVVFGLTIERTGLLIASVLAVSIAALAQAGPQYRQIGLLAVGLSIGACLLFSVALQLPLRILP